MFFVLLKYAFTGEEKKKKKKTDTLVNELLLANQQALLIFVLPFPFVSLPSNQFFFFCVYALKTHALSDLFLIPASLFFSPLCVCVYGVDQNLWRRALW